MSATSSAAPAAEELASASSLPRRELAAANASASIPAASIVAADPAPAQPAFPPRPRAEPLFNYGEIPTDALLSIMRVTNCFHEQAHIIADEINSRERAGAFGRLLSVRASAPHMNIYQLEYHANEIKEILAEADRRSRDMSSSGMALVAFPREARANYEEALGILKAAIEASNARFAAFSNAVIGEAVAASSAAASAAAPVSTNA
jgi:hypothetical protein